MSGRFHVIFELWKRNPSGEQSELEGSLKVEASGTSPPPRKVTPLCRV
jgi:hypothetical protein